MVPAGGRKITTTLHKYSYCPVLYMDYNNSTEWYDSIVELSGATVIDNAVYANIDIIKSTIIHNSSTVAARVLVCMVLSSGNLDRDPHYWHDTNCFIVKYFQEVRISICPLHMMETKRARSLAVPSRNADTRGVNYSTSIEQACAQLSC